MTTIASAALGLSVAVGLLAWAWFARGARWRRVAAGYAVRTAPPRRAERRFQSVVMRDPSGLWTAYQAAVHLGVCDQGLVLRPALPFALGYPTLVLPFEAMRLRETSWYLNARSYAVELPRCPLAIVLDAEQVDWLTANADALQGRPT